MSLFVHQDSGALHLALNPRHLLGDEPGLGKTRTLLQAAKHRGLTRPLVICPAIVRTHWRRECEEMGVDAGVVSYHEAVARPQGGDGAYDALIVDESHYLKHEESRRTQAILGTGGYARRYQTVWLASGTPMPKNPTELYPQVLTLNPRLLIEHDVGTADAWKDRFCVTRQRRVRRKFEEKVVGVRNVEELREILGQVMLRRTLREVGLDVPEIWWQLHRLDNAFVVDKVLAEYTSPGQVAAMRDFLERGGNVMELITDPHVARLRRKIGELKAKPVAEEAIDFLEHTDEKLILFGHHTDVIRQLAEWLGPYGVAFIDGSVSDRKRGELIDFFQTDRRCRVFIGQNQACQTGITLTASSRVMLVEPDWNADVNLQLAKRVARIGQTASRCIAQMVCLADSLDEMIVRQNHRETAMQNTVLG